MKKKPKTRKQNNKGSICTCPIHYCLISQVFKYMFIFSCPISTHPNGTHPTGMTAVKCHGICRMHRERESNTTWCLMQTQYDIMTFTEYLLHHPDLRRRPSWWINNRDKIQQKEIKMKTSTEFSKTPDVTNTIISTSNPQITMTRTRRTTQVWSPNPITNLTILYHNSYHLHTHQNTQKLHVSSSQLECTHLPSKQGCLTHIQMSAKCVTDKCNDHFIDGVDWLKMRRKNWE